MDPWPHSVGWGSGVAVSCGVDHTLGSDPALLWLWDRPADAAPISPLAWELPCAVGMALKSKEKKQKRINMLCTCGTCIDYIYFIINKKNNSLTLVLTLEYTELGPHHHLLFLLQKFCCMKGCCRNTRISLFQVREDVPSCCFIKGEECCSGPSALLATCLQFVGWFLSQKPRVLPWEEP